MRRAFVDRVTRLAGWLRRGHRAEVPSRGPVKVNLGSSLLVAPGWVNVDGALSALVASWPTPALRLFYRLAGLRAHLSEAEYLEVLKGNRFVHYNLEYGIPLPEASADYAFASHFLEHLSKRHGEHLMRETLRVLKPGGVVRVAIPDLAVFIGAYGEGRKEEAMDGIFEDWELGDFARHRYMYDFDMLAGLLGRAGFTDVRRCEYREGRVPDLDELDNRPGSLVVEAAKPA
ncbi:MAG TPA: methyltransferase domain-containing protein [Thermoleophilaceae bacterium]|nr:methyltransferase domain-containing protein [Thermoleophilaceae bacterium]